jgi:AcrR family transcriptional regulator
MTHQIADKTGSSHSRRRILDAAIRSYREIGYRKTTMADVARGASMSAANVYRFFSSRQALEEAVVAALLDKIFLAAATAAGSDASALERLGATLSTLSQLHEDRLANDAKLHELVAAAVHANYPVILAFVDRVRGVVQSIIVAGQASGEIRPGNPMVLACCLLDAMDAYVGPSPAKSITVRPTFDEMMKFCAGALRNDTPLRSIGARRNAWTTAAIYQS